MTNRTNTTVRLAKRPPPGQLSADTWAIASEPVRALSDGEVMVEVEVLAMEPAMRSWINAGPSYVEAVELGDVMRAAGVGRVVASRTPSLAEGDWVYGRLGVQKVAVVSSTGLSRFDPTEASPERFLNVLGMTGMTAYFGLTEVGRAVAGETILVSAAAGAVGGLVGQIARLLGCRTIGLAGGPEKCAYVVDELGFEACIDYKSEDVSARIHALAPDGIDVYFDNVGGPTLDAALANIRRGARIVICGAISAYNDLGSVAGPKNYLRLLAARARMEGFVVLDYLYRYPEGRQRLATWLKSGELVAREQVESGVERFPEVLNMLFEGKNTGKLLLRP